MDDKERQEKDKENRQFLLKFDLARETLDGAITEEDIDAEICKRLQDGVDDEYLVDGALLTCTRAKWGSFDLPSGGSIEIDGHSEKMMTGEPTTHLHVMENPMSDNGLCHATIADTVQEGNIYPFPCNCREAATLEQEKDIIANKDECQRRGVCKYLMDLEEEWENINFGVSYAQFPYNDASVPGSVGASNILEPGGRLMSELKAGITMTSVLFCRHGGFIYPLTSGQNIVVMNREWAIKTLEQYLKGEQDEEQAKKALEVLAEQTLYTLPKYESVLGVDYNKYDTYMLGWAEYYNDQSQYKIYPIYIKAQCYIESRVGQTGGIPTANPQNDIMQALDIKNYNIYSYVGISVYQFKALTSSGSYEGGDYFWDKNHKGEVYPNGSQCDSDKMQRCGGIISNLFTENQDGSGGCFYEGSQEQYYYQHEKVTPIMSIGVAMDKMMEELQKSGGDYRKALEKYNGSSEKQKYANSIINIATQNPPIKLE